jgi:hypothetical protein
MAENIVAGRYYMWRGHGVLAVNPSQWCNKGFDVTLCRYVGETMKFYAPSKELRPIKPPPSRAQPIETPIANKIAGLRKKGRSYKEIAHTLNVEGSRTQMGMEWSSERVRACINYRKRG